MDTQINLSFTLRTIINSKIVKEEKRNINIYEYIDSGEEELISFKEHTKVILKFDSSDKMAILKVQGYNNEGYEILKSGDSCEVSPGIEQTNMLVPGYYPIIIETSNKAYEFNYKIEPSSISWNSLINIREYLETIVEGLTYNTENKKEYYNKKLNYNYNFYHILNSNINKLNFNLQSIINNPITNLEKKYKKSMYLIQVDSKTERLNLKEGLYNNSVKYTKHIKLNKDIKENKWIKKMVYDLYKELIKISEHYSIEYRNLNLIESNNMKVMDKTKEFISKIEKEKVILYNYLNRSWLIKIKDFKNLSLTSLSLLKDRRYLVVYNTYKKIISNEIVRKYNKMKFSSKNTSKLFEYYVYILAIKILQELGYIWIRGCLIEDKGLNNVEILSGTKLIFEKKDVYCELVYNTEIKKDEITKSDFISINSIHTKPDIMISVFSKNTNRLQKNLIIEVKCRKKRYIIDKKGDVINQLNDYFNLGYIYYNEDKISIPQRGVVDKVIVVYPKQDDNEYKEYIGYRFPLIPLEARQMDFHYGYNELKEEIENILEQ